MSLWLFRLCTLVFFPFFTYSFILRDKTGLLAGIACALILIIVEFFFKKLRIMKMMIAVFGCFMGYLVYIFFNHLVFLAGVPQIVGFWETYQNMLVYGFIFAGFVLSIIKSNDLEGITTKGPHLKVVDSTALIDGRIIDLVDINFLQGIIIIPQMVIENLHTLAASKDSLESARGSRGLDIATRLQELKTIPVRITSKVTEGDSEAEKVIKLAKSLQAEVVTLDFNVNKIASVYDVIALNISDLSTALKPVVLPGESMSIFIMKDGKEKGQGIGYLDDGTMVVVEEGQKHVGKKVEAVVYSILQTSSGRMIFAKIK